VTGMRVIIHAPTPDALERAKSNARNLLSAQPDCTCEIVVNASAVAVALAQQVEETDPLLRICGNTLKRKSLSAPGRFRVVDAAIVYLAERQADGWVYVRA
jgi:NitT/TauT family transport system ATP-binding protein